MANLGLNYALTGDPKTAYQWLSRAAAHPNASDNVQANFELVKGYIAQATPPAAPSYSQQPRQPQNGRPQVSPQQYSQQQYSQQQYSERQNTQPQNLRPQNWQPQNSRPQNSRPQNSQLQNSQQRPHQYGAYQRPVTAASSYALSGATPTRAPVNVPSQAQTSQPQETVATSRNILGRIAKNVGPKTAPRPSYAPTNAQQQPNYINNAAPSYNVAQNQAAPVEQLPQIRGGYPSPQVPYYNSEPSAQPLPQRRSPARQR